MTAAGKGVGCVGAGGSRLSYAVRVPHSHSLCISCMLHAEWAPVQKVTDAAWGHGWAAMGEQTPSRASVGGLRAPMQPARWVGPWLFGWFRKPLAALGRFTGSLAHWLDWAGYAEWRNAGIMDCPSNRRCSGTQPAGSGAPGRTKEDSDHQPRPVCGPLVKGLLGILLDGAQRTSCTVWTKYRILNSVHMPRQTGIILVSPCPA